MDKRANLTPAQRALLEKRIKGKGPVMPASVQKKTGIPRRPPGESPLSYSQERMWVMEQMEPDAAVYNVPFAVTITGELDRDLLSQSIHEVIRRHEALRTTFPVTDGTPTILIHQELSVPITALDVRDVPEGEREEAAKRLAREEAKRPFDLIHGPLVRVTTIRKADEEHLLLFTLHHIISDGWSLGVLINEFSVLYASFKNGLPSPLPELPIQYSDFAYWQKQPEQQAALQTHLDYWQEQLGGALEPLQLPTDRPRPSSQTFDGSTIQFMVSKQLSDGVQQLSVECGTSLFMTLLAAFQTFLARYTGQGDILVGSPIANRNRHEIEGLVGVLINTLVHRSRIEQGMTFRGLLEQVRRTTLDAFAHQDIPFEKLVEVLQADRNMAYSPLFQAMFVLQNNTQRTLSMPGLTLRTETLEMHTAQFDITLSFFETENGLWGHWEYNTDLYDAATVERMIRHYQTLLSSIVEHPDAPLADLRLLTEKEEQQLLHEWTRLEPSTLEMKCLHQHFEDQAARTPDAEAVICGAERLTYRELNERANQLANYLQAQGVVPETLVAISVERTPWMVIATLAVLKAGGAYVPIDPTYPEERIATMLRVSDPALVLTDEKLAGLQQELALLPATNPTSSVEPHNLAYVIFTSGTTGVPKGVMVQHDTLHTYSEEWRTKFGYDQIEIRELQYASMSFDVFVGNLIRALHAGGALVIVPQETRLDFAALYRMIQEERVTVFDSTPGVLIPFTTYIWENRLPLDHLKLLILGADALASADYALLLERFGDRMRMVNCYGITEATIDSSAYEAKKGEYDPTLYSTVPIGRPNANTRLYILDTDLRPQPIGVAGELYVGGAAVARGYYNRPDLTAERFLPSPFEPGERLYKSGDLVRWLPDGNIQFLGRVDQQVKLRGFRIELGEIEAVLNEHPSILQSVAAVVNDGQDLVAYYTGASVPAEELSAGLKERLPAYMVPSAFMLLDQFPLSPNGKIDRRLLPVPDAKERHTEYVAPRNHTEARLAELWSELLPVEEISIHDNFFEIGGHSLLATRLVARVNSRFEIQVQLRSLFDAPTIAQFAAMIDEQEPNGAPPILPAAREDHLPLSYAQERLWFLDQLHPNTATYNVPAVVRISGSLDSDAFFQAFQTVVERHESLRTTFQVVDGQPKQIISDQVTVAPSLSVVNSEEAALTEALEEARKPFDLSQGPLVRAKLLRLSEQDHLLLLTMHHIITDEWSMEIFIAEMAKLYGDFAMGQTPQVAPLPIQYADYAVWQREWLQGEVLDNQLQYWKQQLGGDLPILQLPTDFPRPAMLTGRGSDHTFQLSANLTGKLNRLSQQEGATLFMTLLAAFNTLLYRYTGQADILIGSPIAGRGRKEIEGLIGFFVNTLVLRTDLSGEPSFAELVGRVRETTLQAYEHQDVPFETLVKVLQPERDMSRSPLFQVCLVLQNEPLPDLELAGITLSSVELDLQTAKFDLTMTLSENGDGGMTARLEYNTELFEASTTSRLAEHFVILLQAAVDTPTQSISTLPLTTAEERERLLHGQHDVTAFPQSLTIHELFEEQAARVPERIAVVCEQQELTYRELNERANRLAHHLQAQGVGPESLVGLCVERSVEMIVGILGILKAGGAYVPLDPTYPQERLAFLMEDSQIEVLVTQEQHLHSLPPHGAAKICLDRDWDAISSCSVENPYSGATPDTLAYVIYTSGSTGKPKGVLIPHSNVGRLMEATEHWYRFDEHDVWTAFHSYAFDFSVWEIWGALLYGGKLVVVPYWVSRTPEAFCQLLIAERVTVLNQTPSAFRQFMQAEAARVDGGELSLRYVIFGGEALDLPSLKPWFDRHGDRTPQLINMYGITETTVHVTYRALTMQDATEGTGSVIGTAIPDLQVYVLDRHLEPVPVGVTGEMYIGGAGLARGYHNRPDLTEERFIKHPFCDGEKLYKTGDLARLLPTGELEYAGRIDEQVKIRGFRIELGEIQAVLSQHPELQTCVVIAREDQPGDLRLAAYLVAEPDNAPDAGELRAFLQERLPAYMVPVHYVRVDEIPLTQNGKLDRRRLPVPEMGERVTEYVAPRNQTEQRLAELWSEMLGVPDISVHDDFFELGGHSLMATQIAARVREEFSVTLELRELFDKTTIAEVAEMIAAAENAPAPIIQRRERPRVQKKQ
ncbi:amino acid adenylation domain-containing protein [Tumebacillus sp. BK434]|uniref:non-ribosomal peptide synthetase n=1 Tax=Tumebacillus sp. BK434 TaxID=2512169 RepID=UPI001047BAB5|nr:non-ribosomal peptide synthetase [Tumebacillus sp. BK434]TCP59055.1 amino acid adenylation domain-containing protein [Tumebacillus sp. BK434]